MLLPHSDIWIVLDTMPSLQETNKKYEDDPIGDDTIDWNLLRW